MNSITALATLNNTNALIYEAIKGLLSEVDKSTGDVYFSTINEYLEWAEQNPYKRASVSVAAYVSYLSKDRKLSPSTVANKLSHVRRLFEWFARVGLATPLDLADVKNVKSPRHQGRRAGKWLNEDQLRQLINAPDNIRDKAALALMVGCGLRCSEVVGFDWEQIQEKDGKYVIVNLQRKHHRTQEYLPIPNWVISILNELPTRQGRVIVTTTRTIYNIVDRWSSYCGFSVAPHDLRRSAATYALNKGQSITQVSKLLGHSNTTVTERYLRQDFDIAAMADAMELKL